MTTTCVDCIHWMTRDDVVGECVLTGEQTAGDTTCEYAEEGDEDETD